MKRFFSILLTGMLLLSSSIAYGDSLPDFGKLTNEALPDPGIYSHTGGTNLQSGSIFKKEYSYNGKLYDAWQYGKPEDIPAFLSAYQDALSRAGYTFYDGKEMEYDALFFSDGKEDGFLLYDYQSRMLLMVPVSYGFQPGQAERNWDVPSIKPYCMATGRRMDVLESKLEYALSGTMGTYKSTQMAYNYVCRGLERDFVWIQDYINALINTGEFVLVGTGEYNGMEYSGRIVYYWAFTYRGKKAAQPIWYDDDDDAMTWSNGAVRPDYHLRISATVDYTNYQWVNDAVTIKISFSPELVYEDYKEGAF